MNKKVVLSVLSTAVVASMATSAFAKVNDGLYLGGNVKKYYSTQTLFDMNDAARAQFNSYIAQLSSDFNQIVYVNQEGKGASIQEILNEGLATAIAEPLAAADFADSYSQIGNDGSVVATVDPQDELGGTPAELKVESVSAINPITVEVKFNKEVNLSSAQTPANYEFNGAAFPVGTTYTLQADKKTVVIGLPLANKLASGTTFLLTVKNVQDTAEGTVETFNKAVSFSDTEAPTLGAVSYPNNNTAQVSFSEPMSALAASAVKFYDETGAETTDITTTGIAAGGKDLVIDLTGATANKTYTVKVFGALDLSNNPAGTKTFTVVKTIADTTAPTVSSIQALGLDTFKVTFSEKIVADAANANRYGTFDIDNGTVTGNLVAGDANLAAAPSLSADGKELTVQLTAPLAAGIHTVKINNAVDASLNPQTVAVTKTLNFQADTTGPEVTSATVQKVSGVDTLLVKFDGNVSLVVPAPADAITGGKRVDDNVEYTVAAFGGAATLYDPDGDGVSDTIAISLTGQSAGTYTVNLAAVVEDAVGNDNLVTPITFTYTPSANGNKPAVVDTDGIKTNGIDSLVAQAAGTPNEIVVEFNKDVTAATALNVANYLVDGQQVFEKAVFVGDKRHVRLTLKQNAIAASTNYSFTIKNVADANGNVMDQATYVQFFTENVNATLKSATVASANTITLTTSEDLVAGTLTDGNDLAFYIGGVEVENPIATVASVDAKTYTITLATPLTASDLSKTLEIKVLSTADATDASKQADGITVVGNALTGSVTVQH